MVSIASLVASADGGDPRAAEDLFALLYSELQGIARRELARFGGRNAALGVTSLIHQAYLAMATRDASQFPDQARFMAYAARVMRGLLIDHARRRCAQKRGGKFEITTLESQAPAHAADAGQLDAINDALAELQQVERELVEVVDLKFFCGFTLEEIAALQSVSQRTVERRWERARLYLHRSLRDIPID